jgi:tetratricopeptide (TPR) repeat protein
LLLFCFLWGQPVFSQEASQESLRLPEVVITGIDLTKIQRELPKVIPFSPLSEISESSRDHSDTLVRDGDRFSLTQPQQAKQRYLQAVVLDPTNSRAYIRLGDMYRALQQYSTAAEAYEKAIEFSPRSPEAHYKLGILYESDLKEPQKAIEHYRTYVQLGGTDTRVRIWLKDIES